MTAIIDVEKNDFEELGINDVLTAFVGDELRGVGEIIYIAEDEKNVCFIQMYSDEGYGETIRFELWDAEREMIMDISDEITFVGDDHYGSVDAPFILKGEGYGPEIPDEIGLSQNFPNPFNPITEIRYNLPIDQNVAITIYDLNGRVVKTLVDGMQPAGYHKIIWDGTNANGMAIATGIYFYQMKAGDYVEINKMVLLK